MTANVIALLFNGLTLALALGLLVLILWQNPRSEGNRYFSLFLFMVVLWASGALLGRAAAYVNAGEGVIQIGLRLLDMGFTGASVAIYIYSAVITGIRGAFFRLFALVGVGLVLAYQALLWLVIDSPRAFDVTPNGVLLYYFDTPSALLYLGFQVATILLVWRNRNRIRSRTLAYGILLFALAQVVGLLSPRVRMLGGAEDLGSVAALMMSYAVVREQIMLPLLGRAKQLEAVRDVSLAVTSRLRLQDTLAAVAAQAAGLLDADGAAIFLLEGAVLKLAAVFNLPEQFVGHEVHLGQGIVGTVAVQREAVQIENYARDWKDEPDLPLAHETFGAVAAVPLVFADQVVGVLLVVQGRQGGLFDRDDVHLLELLGPQAAVAITNSRLFEAERQLSHELSAAKERLEVVLTSTQNPVVAVDRQLRLIFANPAAEKLLGVTKSPVGQPITDFVAREWLPSSLLQMVRGLRRQQAYIYEVAPDAHTYLCHVAELGKPRPEGWVAVLNDVTQLKELDRLKSQMIQMTSHDLKNPLQAAMSYLELLVEDGEDIFTQSMRDDADMIWKQFERMFRMINGILDLERIESGTPSLDVCVLEDVLGRVVVDGAGPAHNKGVTLELEIKESLPPVLADSYQLSQAFTNLVGNAIKFTPEGGHVWVRAWEQGRRVVVEVADTGIGIPLPEQPRVFERFYRGQQQGVVHVDGSGLGLALVKAVIERHRGEIALESTPGRGTTMRVVLPITEDL